MNKRIQLPKHWSIVQKLSIEDNVFPYSTLFFLPLVLSNTFRHGIIKWLIEIVSIVLREDLSSHRIFKQRASKGLTGSNTTEDHWTQHSWHIKHNCRPGNVLNVEQCVTRTWFFWEEYVLLWAEGVANNWKYALKSG